MKALRGLRLTIARDLKQTPQKVDRMPFADAVELASDYRFRPPLHVLAAGYLGIKPEEDRDEGGDLTEDDIRELRALEMG